MNDDEIFKIYQVVKTEALALKRSQLPGNSAYKSLATLLWQFDQMWLHIKRKKTRLARADAITLAALAINFLLDTKQTEKN